MTPIRYFILNSKTDIMHIHGYCPQTRDRSVPIRLFDTPRQLEEYAGRKLQLCLHCQKNLKKK